MKPVLAIVVLIISGLALAGCGPSSSPIPPTPEPTATQLTITIEGQAIELVPGVNVLPEIYEAAKSPELLENSDWVFVDGYWDLMPRGAQIPLEVEGPLLEAANQLPFAGFPEKWASYSLPTLGLEFDYPSGWQIETLEAGVRLFPPAGPYSIRVEAYPNPLEASLRVWLAEYGPDIEGEILAELEDAINSEPVLRQQVMRAAQDGDPSEKAFFCGWPPVTGCFTGQPSQGSSPNPMIS